MLRGAAKLCGAALTGVAATSAAHCDREDNKYFDPEALERGAKASSKYAFFFYIQGQNGLRIAFIKIWQWRAVQDQGDVRIDDKGVT
jgi:hypothetical protein